jgi:hypothetical protein
MKLRKLSAPRKVYITRDAMSKYQNHEFKCQRKSYNPFIHEN